LPRVWNLAPMAVPCAALAPAVAGAATYRMVIQIHPDVGGKCIDVPFAQFVIGMRVQMCNNGKAQIFIYDEQSQEPRAEGRHYDARHALGVMRSAFLASRLLFVAATCSRDLSNCFAARRQP
jgi:hypothetical protein